MFRSSPHTDYPSAFRRALLGAVVLLVLGALGYRVASIIAPPTLAVREPSDQLSTSSRTITIAGETEPGVTLTINGETFVPDLRGAFTTDVVLLPGVNTIAIEARRRHGWPARIERRVYVRAADAPVAGTNYESSTNPANTANRSNS